MSKRIFMLSKCLQEVFFMRYTEPLRVISDHSSYVSWRSLWKSVACQRCISEKNLLRIKVDSVSWLSVGEGVSLIEN